MIFSNRYAREAAGFFVSDDISRIEKGQLWVNLLQFRWIKGGGGLQLQVQHPV
jgi:hypothetical protein